MKNIRGWLLASSVLAGVTAVGATAPAMAQEAEQASQVADIVVTGSRIRQRNLVTTSPVTQVSSEDIDVQGVTRVEDLVTQLPQAFASQNSTVSNGASGTATVSLRNLGADRTLVLIDGKRMGYGSASDAAADLNQIPGQMVERVEVLTGGASAVYGSDAVAGVVNFIMRKNFEGIELDASYGFYQHNNDYDGIGNLRKVIEGRGQTSDQFRLPDDDIMVGFSREVNMIMGVNAPDDRGNITLYAGYRKNNKVLQRDYDYSACAIGDPSDAAPNDFTCAGSGTSFPGYFTDFVTNGYAYTLDENNNFVDYVGSRDAYNYGPINYFQRPDERYTLGAFGHYQVNDKLELYTQLMFSDYRTVAQIAPSGNFFGEFANGFRTTDGSSSMSCATPLLSAQQLGAIQAAGYCAAPTDRFDIFIGRRNVEGGGRQSDLSFQSFRGVIGARGELDEGWSYDFSAQYQRVKESQIYRNEFSNTRLARALDVVRDGNGNLVCSATLAGLDADCVPYNIFRRDGVTQDALNYLQVPLLSNAWTQQQIINLSFAVDLGVYGVQSPWANNPVQIAFGSEFRRDSLDLTPDVSFTSGDGAGQGGPFLGLSGSNEVIDVYGEAQIPLVEGRAFADQIALDLAYRHSEYKLGGGTDAWKIGGDWAPTRDIRFRASVQRAVRAPNVIELFTAQGVGLFNMTTGDPCYRGNATYAGDAACIGTNPWQVTLAQSNNASLNSPAAQYNVFGGGNPNLAPETSDTYTFGLVFTPSAVPGLNISVDYFDISIEDLISSVGSLNTLQACYANGLASACERIERNSNGQLWVGSGQVVNLATNIGGLQTSGIDISANYRFDLGDRGNLGFAMTGTWLNELVTDTGLGFSNSVYDCAGYFGSQCGTPNAEWRHRFRVDYSPNDVLTINGTWRHFSEVEQAILGSDGSLNNASGIDRIWDAQNYFDIAATWRMRDNVTLRAGVNNVFDRDPPISPAASTDGNGNTFPQTYDSMGRYVFFGVTANF